MTEQLFYTGRAALPVYQKDSPFDIIIILLFVILGVLDRGSYLTTYLPNQDFKREKKDLFVGNGSLSKTITPAT